MGIKFKDYKCYKIEAAEAVGWVLIRHPKTHHVVDSCTVDQYKKLIDGWFSIPESFENDHP